MEGCVGAHRLSRRLKALGHDARLMPAKCVRPRSKGHKNDFRDAEAIAEAVRIGLFHTSDGQFGNYILLVLSRGSAATLHTLAVFQRPYRCAGSAEPNRRS
jgi:hypothetical protein